MYASAIMTLMLAVAAAQASEPRAFARKYYTDAKLQVMRENIEKYSWARDKRDATVKAAERWAKYDDQRLCSIVIPPQVPRAYQVHNFGCPVHGIEVHSKGLYKWEVSFDKPFKIKCPVGGEEYPSNDFGAFLASGMKDRSLLTGPHADDGWGWHKPNDKEKANHWFVAYYAHWSMMKYLRPAIQELSLGAVVTEDPHQARLYAHKCAVLLWQLAVYYPEYAYHKQSREGREHNPNYTGKLYNRIWEVYTPNDCAPAYDAIRPFLPGDEQLQKLAGKTAEQLDTMIRERLLLEAARCITDGSGRIAGNYGMHQKSLILLARVLDEHKLRPTSEEMIQYVAANPNPQSGNDLGLRDALENFVYRDGIPLESLAYNVGWVNDITDVAEALTETGANIFEHPRFRKLLTWPFDACIAGKFTPSMGDTGDMFARDKLWRAETLRKAHSYVKDPRIDWVVHKAGPSACDLFGLPSDLDGEEVSPPAPPDIGLGSFLFPAYGLANLQAGGEINRTGLSLFFGGHMSHMHSDQLNMLIFSHGNALLTDIGYPEQTDAFNHKRAGFFSNTIAHNTVTVDTSHQHTRGASRLHAFSPHGFAQVVDASCTGVYSNKVSLYRRACMFVSTTPDQAYVFDAFYVRGGGQHDYSAHGTQADLYCEPPLGPVQEKGTLAGPDVPYEQFYDDATLKDKALGSVPYGGYRGSGFQFLTNVKRAPLEGSAVCDWRLTEPLKGQGKRPWKGIGLRAHLIGTDEELIACDGPVQKYAYLPKTVKFMIRRRTGKDLTSSFVTVYEPYQCKTWIERVASARVEPNDGQAVAAFVELTDGGKHYLFHSLTPATKYTVDGKVTVTGQAACLALGKDGTVAKAMLLNGTKLAMGGFSMPGMGMRRSKIVSIDYAKGIIELADPLLDESVRPGQVLQVAPDTFADCVAVRDIVDKTRFSIGDEDLRVAGGPILQVAGKEITTPVPNPHARPGMTVINTRLEPIGRLVKRVGAVLTLDRTVKPEQFPQAKGDAGPRYAIVMAGPGDEVRVSDVILKE